MREWLTVMAVSLSACLGWAPPVAAAGPGCPPTREVGIVPTIDVMPEVPNPQYRYDVNKVGLTRMMGAKGSNGGRHSMTLGLTVGTFGTSWEISSSTIRKGNLLCHYLRNAKVRLQVPSLIVYIASDYRQGSCQFQTITTHENEHVRVNQAVVRKYAPIMRETLLTAAYRLSPVATSGEAGPQAIERALQPTILAVLNDMYKERDRGNGVIDTDDAYRRTSQRCSSW